MSPSRPTYRIVTLGCRSNFAETREFESILRSRGCVRARESEPADVEIVHSCSVTNRAAAKSRNAVRRAVLRRGAAASSSSSSADQRLAHSRKILVTGCYAATHAPEAARLTHPDDVLPQEAPDGGSLIQRFTDRLDQWLDRRGPCPSIRPAAASCSADRLIPLPVIDPAPGSSEHVRAELRIQDGCDAHCTFCIIPSIRRTLRSKPIPDVVGEARRLVDLGHLEIVLTGIFIGAYGHETALRRRQANRDAEPLAELLDAVAQVPGLQRLRISSMEPGDVTGPLLAAMVANRPVVVPHLHLPVQSGSDRILRRMNRQYRIGDYLEMIDAVNEALTADGLPPAITTDIICGFPGETEDDFQQTVDVVRRVGYLHMHVFPFSARGGTAAARWTDQFIADPEKRRRVRRLIELEHDGEHGLSIAWRRRLIGRTTRVILEQPDPHDGTLVSGRCDHYALIHVRSHRQRGSLESVRITAVGPARTSGEVVAPIIARPVVQ